MKFKRDKMGIAESYFADRWAVYFRRFSIRFHKWIGSDDPDSLHDHASWFITLVLWGGYDDITLVDGVTKVERMRPGMIRFRRAEHLHRVLNKARQTWTLCIFGEPQRRWSFVDPKGRRMRRDKYFAEIGHHTDKPGVRIRIRPDGTRI